MGGKSVRNEPGEISRGLISVGKMCHAKDRYQTHSKAGIELVIEKHRIRRN